MGEHLPVTLMCERWQGLAQATTPPPSPVLPLHPKTQAQKPAAFAKELLSHPSSPPRRDIWGSSSLLSPSQRLAASRLIALKCSAGRYSLQLAGIAKSI